MHRNMIQKESKIRLQAVKEKQKKIDAEFHTAKALIFGTNMN